LNNLVIVQKDDVVTDSLSIAKGVDNEHRAVLQLIRTYKNDLEDFGTLAFEMRKTRGRPQEVFYLNESQTYFLLTLMKNNETVTRFKKELVKEFVRMRKALFQLTVQKQSDEWKLQRLQGKTQRKETTDTIKDFTQYAVKQGSQNALRYYSNLTKMEYKALFILQQRFPNVREFLNDKQLGHLRTADHIVEEALKDGMEAELDYKDIYQLAKERVEEFAKLVKPSIVITADAIYIEGDK